MPTLTSMNLPARLTEVAGERRFATAIASRSARWTYEDLAGAMLAVSSRLASMRLTSGSRVGLLFRNSPHYVAAYYGVLHAGCVVVPLNPHERAETIARQLACSEARLIIGDLSHPEFESVSALADVPAIAIETEGIGAVASYFMGSMGNTAISKDVFLESDALAAIVFTSGTTGNPKGVMLSHANLASNSSVIADYLELSPADRGIAVLPLQFAYGNSVLHSHLAAGAELLLEESFAYPQAVLQRMSSEGVTGFSGVPSTFSLLLSRCNLSAFDLGRLRYLTQAGGPMSVTDIRRVQTHLPQARLYVMYGQTEATARLAYLPPDRLVDKAGSVGMAIPGVEIAVLSADGKLAAPGVTGEIVARGPNVMLGYLNDPPATLAALRDGWLHTGDAGHLDADGFLYVDGRSSEMIKVGSFRISPYEIEEVISAIQGVDEVAVGAVPDSLLGQAVKAVIVPRDGIGIDAQAVRAHCRRHLAIYKVPKHVEFARTLPRTATGKVQRRLIA